MAMVMRFSPGRAGALALGLVLLAVGPAAAADPIRVGYLGPLTGIFAQAGKDMLDGFKMAFDQAYFHAVMYSAGRWIVEAARALDGNVEDRDRLLAALRKASETTEDPRGPIKLDEYGNPSENVYIVKVEKVGGRLQNTIIHTYPMVSQFWTYKPEEFLKTPVYERNYPPVKP